MSLISFSASLPPTSTFVLRDHRQFGLRDLDARRPHPLPDVSEGRQIGRDDELLALLGDILRAGFDCRLEDLLLRRRHRVDVDLSPSFELPRHGASRAEGAAILGQDVPDVRNCPILVVRKRLDVQRHAPRRVALVHDPFVAHALQLAGPLLDGALDVVLRHVRGLGGIHRETQPRIEVRVATTLPRPDRDLTDELGEHLAALVVVYSLLALDLGPLVVSCHAPSLFVAVRPYRPLLASFRTPSIRSCPTACPRAATILLSSWLACYRRAQTRSPRHRRRPRAAIGTRPGRPVNIPKVEGGWTRRGAVPPLGRDPLGLLGPRTGPGLDMGI